jgi:uncharacterized membrane protein
MAGRAPAFLFGVGLGGLIDGIVLHQLLQWHHMVSDTKDYPVTSLAGLEGNTVGDGLFHLLTWLVLVLAMALTVRAWQRRELAPPWRVHIGLLLAGWGAFNVVEGVVDHLVLGIHHVRDDLGGPVGWDIGFLVVGALLVAMGGAMGRRAD